MSSSQENIFEFIGIERAEDKQRKLSSLVKSENELGFNPTLICGLDAAYLTHKAVAVAAVWDLETRETIEEAAFRGQVSLDYLPGFLGFREGRLLVGAIDLLQAKPDVFLVDGHGRAHPRRFGLACHLGLAIDKPTVGIAKSCFYGSIDGERIVDSNGEILGTVLPGKQGKAYYISIGHKMNIDYAAELVRKCAVNNYPVPLRIAHSETVRLRRSL
jgi:deoxyribonuclease V